MDTIKSILSPLTSSTGPLQDTLVHIPSSVLFVISYLLYLLEISRHRWDR
jgi:hypothetical protein